MADVVLDLQNASSKELFGQGVRAYVLQDYDTAVQALSQASELLSEEHGNETHDSLGDVYLYYGKALLELNRKESGPLGDVVLKNIEEESESEEDGGEEEHNKSGEESKAEENTAYLKKKEKSAEENETKAVEEVNAEAVKAEATEGVSFQGKAELNGKTVEILPEAEKDEETEEELTDLQVAWEVLELAKRIFLERGEQGKKNLAEAFIVLGEISLESGNYTSSIDDITQGLNIQKKLFGNDSRTIAETYYKLGGAFSTNGQIREAIESFQTSFEYLQNKLENLKVNKEQLETNQEEIEELNVLIPEIKEKIADMRNLIVEIANKAATTRDDGKSSGSCNMEPSSSKPANNISHLVKRKRKDDEVQEGNPAKKPSP